LGLIARPNRETRNYTLTVAIRIPADGPVQVPVVRTERAIEQPADRRAVNREHVEMGADRRPIRSFLKVDALEHLADSRISSQFSSSFCQPGRGSE